jgi:hypothetical protein
MYTAKHEDSYNRNEGPEIHAVMLYNGSNITADNSISLYIKEAKQFYDRREAISRLPYWQGQGCESNVIDITERIKLKQQVKIENQIPLGNGL